ncbi:hypothetical protein QFC21_003213 [Naganishia friedmannii]|uniref:Uncharacterized protein n=1 Tax=Naganishia friedmannii TaxID=89922 RepID=A0ACC2VR37_9TREE|nr:hypothetical protein QFC21_003213 [Naganishia friedmannii]
MPTATATTTHANQSTHGTLKLRAEEAATPEYLKELHTKGYVVVPNIIPQEQAAQYVTDANEWLKGFGKGFDIDDKSTWNVENLPPHFRGGLYNALGVGHEDLLWRIRLEPALIDVFSKIWGTDELLVSFDGANFSVPLPPSQIQNAGAPWPHVDQSPLKRNMECIQGIANLAPNGEDDGGLMILDGSFPLYNEFIDAHVDDQPEGGWPKIDSYHHTPKQLQWFYDRGCTWKKVNAPAGSLILWESRTIHYGAAPKEGANPRYATYVCYKPAAHCPPAHLEVRKEAIKEFRNMSHNPCDARKVPKFFVDVRTEPSKPFDFESSERARKLAGLESY